MIKHYKHNQIDPDKWDHCLNESPLGNIYCTHWYLSIIHPNWEALIDEKDGQYELIVPLLYYHRGPFIIHRTPILAQRLGMFCSGPQPGDQVKALLNYVKKRFSVFHYPMDLQFIPKQPGIKIKEQPNYYLYLNKNYEALHRGYRKFRKTKLKLARSNDLRVEFSGHHGQLLDLFRENVAPKIPGGVSTLTLTRIKNLVVEAAKRKSGFVATVLNNKNEPLSSAFTVRYKNTLTFLFAATNDEGKDSNAYTFLIDSVISKYSGSSTVLDFSGSHIKGIAEFYIGFGAKKEVYYTLMYETKLAKMLLYLRN